MRILHTADWHLNDRLGRIDRRSDISDRLGEIAGYLREHDVDVLLVAGDLFSTFSRTDALRTALDDVGRAFRPFLSSGGAIVAISGNHDHELTFAMLRAALDLVSPIDPEAPGPRPSGRLHLVSRPTLLPLEGRGGQQVQFALLPYPTPARYLFDEATAYRSAEERNRSLQQALVRHLNVMHHKHVKPELPSVLAAHIHVRGSELHSLYHLSELGDVVFEPGDLPMHWAYVALGHIHKPQALPGAPHVRYSGSIERFDFAERDEEKGVVLIEVGPRGLVGDPTVLPLSATPMYDVVITDPARELPDLADRYPDHEQALIRYSLTWTPGEHDRDDLCRQIEAIFPRWYQRHRPPSNPDIQPTTRAFTGQLRDVRGTVRAYLDDRLTDRPDRADLMSLAEQYLEKLDGAASSQEGTA
jgi:exonuclease SbcD